MAWNGKVWGRPAGLRTHILVTTGSALVMLLSMYAFAGMEGRYDPGRMAAQVVSGIGFLGGGHDFERRHQCARFDHRGQPVGGGSHWARSRIRLLLCGCSCHCLGCFNVGVFFIELNGAASAAGIRS